MNIISIPPIVMSGICTYVGLYYLVMYFKSKWELVNLAFAGSCFATAIYNVSCAYLYSATNFVDGMHAQQGNFIGISLMSISVVWFVITYTKTKPSKIIGILTIFFLATIPVIFFHSSELTLTTDIPAPKHIKLGNLIDTIYYEVEPGPFLLIILLVMVIFFSYLLVLLIRYYRTTRETGILPLLITVVTWFVSVVSDTLVASGVYEFVYICEYVFMFIIFAMAYALLSRFMNLQIEIEEINVNLELKVKDRTYELQSAMEELEAMNINLVETRDHLWGEMQLAKKIQTVLLPVNPLIAGWEISTYMSPADEVGGDYYDVLNVRGNDWIVIGDVSGHGVPAGLIMMMVQTSIHMALVQNPELPPAELLTMVNQIISYNLKQMNEDKYMTITVLAVHEEGKIQFSGLHQDILIYRADSKKIEYIETNGMWIGIVDDIQGMLENNLLTVNKNDAMLIFTDGVTEAWKKGSVRDSRDPERDMFGQDKLKEIFQRLGTSSTKNIVNGIIDELDEGYVCQDDVTIVVMRRK